MIVCGRCGTQNAAGDQFCGNCGAFLEWTAAADTTTGAAAQVAPADLSAPPTQPAAEPAVDASDDAGATPSTAEASPAAAPAEAPAAPSGTPTGPPVVCPACGSANPSGRFFCQSCGGRLPSGATATAARPAATTAVAAAAGSTDAATASAASATQAVSSGSTVDTGLPADATGSGTPGANGEGRAARATNPLVVGGFAVVSVAVLVGVFLANYLGGPAASGTVVIPTRGPASPAGSAGASPAGPAATPTPALTTAPTVVPSSAPSASVGPSVAPSGEPTAAPASPGPSSSAGPTGPPRVEVYDAAASTSLDPDHPPSRTIDGQRSTAWISAPWVDGSSQYLQLAVAPSAIAGVILYAGDQSGIDRFRAVRRPRTISIQLDAAPGLRFELPDTPNPIRIDLSAPPAKLVQVTIEDTYPAEANSVAGSPIEGVAISEIVVLAPTP